MHYPISIAPLWRLWLLLFGVTQKSAFAELSEEGLLVRFGLAEYRISFEEISSASLSTWSIWAGVGWRPDLAGTLALIGAPGRAVDLRLRERKQLGRSGFPYERLVVTLENPERFVDAIGQLIEKASRGGDRKTRRPPGRAKRKTARRSPSARGRPPSKAA